MRGSTGGICDACKAVSLEGGWCRDSSRQIVYAVDHASGTLLWKQSFDEQVEDDLYSSPALDGNGKIIVFDAADGTTLRQFHTDGFVVSCPSLSPEGVAYVGSNDGHVYGIDLHSLKMLWRVNLACEFRYTPFTVLPSGDALFVGTDERLHCLAQHSGQTLWQLEHDTGFHSSPLLTDDGHLVIGSRRNAVHFYQWIR